MAPWAAQAFARPTRHAMTALELDQTALVSDLERALFDRDVRTCFSLVDQAFAGRTPPPGAPPISISLLLCLAQCTDLGYRSFCFLDQFMPVDLDLSQLSVLDFLKLRLTEAFRHLAAERPERTVEILDLVLRIQNGILSDYLLFLANFWKGRAHRKQGEYAIAMQHITAARQVAESMNAPKLAAVTKIHESWLEFQTGHRQHASQLLDEAETVLRPTGHFLSLGNIESARGRFVRRSGDYARALDHFQTAITLYTGGGCPDHPNVARALVNAAYVKRLIALDLQSRGNGGAVTGAIHAKSLQAVREALDLLEQAGRIYALHNHQTGTGSVLVNTAHLHLESGDIDSAAVEAQRALDLGESKQDQILMARARDVLSAVDLARAEEELGDDQEIGAYADRAVEHADTAIALALQTQNKRLLCEAYITRGQAAASEYFGEWDTAREYAAKAAALLSNDDRDHMYKQLRALKARLAAATRIDDMLRLWSAGETGDKSFQQIQEEFAELVIPKIWLRSGKNITSVAKALSISPKKIRRVLRNAKSI